MEALLFVRLSSAFYRLHFEAPFCIWKASWHPFCRIRKLKSKLHRATKRQNVHLDSFMYIFIPHYVRGETALWIQTCDLNMSFNFCEHPFCLCIVKV